MDATQMTAIDEPTMSHAPDSLPQRKDFTVRVEPRVKAALIGMLEAVEYSRDVEASVWDFAIEVASLRRLQLSRSDMRWMVARGFVDHALEVTLPGDFERSFRKPARLLFSKKTCFVLTSTGEALARSIVDRAEISGPVTGRVPLEPTFLALVPALKALTPKWDRDRQELKLGTILVKRFKVPAANQEMILAAFEEEGWPARIDDPLPPHCEQSSKRRLQETIKSLNRNQRTQAIRFLGDGSGQGVRWETVGEGDEAHEHVEASL